MQNFDAQYFEILFPQYLQISAEDRAQLQNSDLFIFLNQWFKDIEAKNTSRPTIFNWYPKPNKDQVIENIRQKQNNLETYIKKEYIHDWNNILLLQYPYVRFLYQNNPNTLNLSPSELAQQINQQKVNYFRYRFASIPFLEQNEECLEFWEEYFEIPLEDETFFESHETLFKAIQNLEASILEDRIFHKLRLITDDRSNELFNTIKKITVSIVQNPQQEHIFQEYLSHFNQTFNIVIPKKQQAPINLKQMFTELFSSIKSNLPEEIIELSDVHGIIQASGFSTQNELSHLAIFDFVNYIKYTQEIKNVKSITNAFLRPLLPLYWELTYISKQPKTLANILRLILPIVLLNAYLIAIETLLHTLPFLISIMNAIHAPEIAMILTMLISIYVGLVLMSYFYENIKMMHQWMTDLAYGGRYQTPVYQVNDRMKAMFGEENAIQVKDMYTRLMDLLDHQIKDLESQQKKQGLNESDLNTLKHSHDERKILELEWMGAHHLQNFSTDKAKQHVKNRLYQQIEFKYEKFKIAKEEAIQQLPQFINENMVKKPENISLFKPGCLKLKSEIEHLKEMYQAIN